MKSAHVIRLFGGVSQVAEALGITPSAVSQWGETVPKLRQYELRERRPSLDLELEKIRREAQSAHTSMAA